jgi:TRAP-type C4-dicarboxylate transport system substrate-binding protein
MTMTATRIPLLALLAVALAAPVMVGCSDDESDAKAGGDRPVTLRIGTDDEPGKPAADQIQELARRVEKLSDGQLRIRPVWHAAGDGPDWDQRVARMVTKGELEMGLIPARAWDTEGVTTLRALNAPFLVTSDALLGEVVSGDLADDLMAGLGEANVTGVALFPEGLRHPFAMKKPLLGPDDYDGAVIRTPTSKTVEAVFEVLGASVNDEDPDAAVHAGLDSAYVLDPGGTATGNVAFFPKVNSLVVNSDAYEELSEEERELLAKAAAETRAWAIDELPADADAAQAYCEEGGVVVNASDAQLEALEQATAPVYDKLSRDETTAELIAAIQRLKQDSAASATAPEECGATKKDATQQTALDGVYRFRTTDKELRANGIIDAGDIDENHGTFTMTLKAGEYCWEQKAPNPLDNPSECGQYEVEGNRMIIRYPVGAPDVYRWKKAPNGDLSFTVLDAADGDLSYARAWTSGGWQRVGDAK